MEDIRYLKQLLDYRPAGRSRPKQVIIGRTS